MPNKISMKIAVTGKGGVGKTLLVTFLSKLFAEAGYSVLAIDADPNSNLAANLGVSHPEVITPISDMKDLVEERTGARPGKRDVYFKLNPRVDDIPDKYCYKADGIKLMVMGRVKRGGSGCYCPENVLLQALVNHLLLNRNEVVIMDMEAGVEHLGRGTAKAVNRLIVVVEPGRQSVETAFRINELAKDIGVTNIAIVGNKIRSNTDREFIISALPGFEILGFIPYDQAIIEADQAHKPIFNASQQVTDSAKDIFKALLSDSPKSTG